MAKPNRINLDRKLRNILRSENVYYRAPEGTKMHYPAFVYKMSGTDMKRADNKAYLHELEYEVTFIGKDPDFDIVSIMLDQFEKCRYVRRYNKDNLIHDVFYLYWRN